MSALYGQGFNSANTSSGSSGSSSNPQRHSHIPSIIAGVIIPSAYNYNYVSVLIPQVQMPFPPEAYVPSGFAPIQSVPFFHQMYMAMALLGEITIILVQDFLQMGLTLDLHIEEITVSKILVATKENGLTLVDLRAVMVVLGLATLRVELMLLLSVKFVTKVVI